MTAEDDFAQAVGDGIRAVRQSRGLSTRGLARLSGVSQPSLSNIENGRVAPSLKTLYAIAEAMGAGPGALLPTATESLQEHAEPVAQGKPDSADVPVRTTLLHAAQDSTLEVYLVEQRSDYRDPDRFGHDGEDIIHVLSGRAELIYGASRLTLSAGDTVWLDGGAPHIFHTYPDTGVVALIVTSRVPRLSR